MNLNHMPSEIFRNDKKRLYRIKYNGKTINVEFEKMKDFTLFLLFSVIQNKLSTKKELREYIKYL